MFHIPITEVSVTDTAHSHAHAVGEKGEQAGRRETLIPVHFIVAHAQHLREHILVREHILKQGRLGRIHAQHLREHILICVRGVDFIETHALYALYTPFTPYYTEYTPWGTTS
jgi:hypothetical protein